MIVPLGMAANSPLLAWRDPVYIVAGFAGVLAMALLLVQPLLAGGFLPGLSVPRAWRVHRWVGGFVVAAVVVHVVGLWITSPPDVIDALLFASPTPFSAWGVMAMWTVFLAAFWAAFRRKFALSPRVWRLGHTALAMLTVIGGVVHSMQIDGTMEVFSKAMLCALTLAATVKVTVDRWRSALW